MVTKSFSKFWEINYGKTPLLAHILRGRFAYKWFRIHNLPDSKRYANNENEMQTILHRQNTLISDLIGNGQEYLLLFYAISENPESVRFNLISDIVLLDNIRLDIALPENYEGECYLISGFINKTWKIIGMGYKHHSLNTKPPP